MTPQLSSVLVDPGRGCYHQPQRILEGNGIIGHGEFWEMMTDGCGESWKIVTPLAMGNLGRR